MNLTFSDLSLVLLVGPSGSGKSSFARKHFRPSEVVSSDYYRGAVCDDESNQAASRDAFEMVHQVVARRLHWRRFTVVDATNVQGDARKPLLELARRYHYVTAAVVFDLDEDTCRRHNQQRPGRVVPEPVIASHAQALRRAIPALGKEGVGQVYTLRSVAEVEAATVTRVPLREDRRGDVGPFDIIGDVHGCHEELLALLACLGYRVGHQTAAGGEAEVVVEPPPGRRAVFVGDLGDRGPDTPGVYRLVAGMVRRGQALCVLGNHDDKLLRKLRGHDVKMAHGLTETVEQFAARPREEVEAAHRFLDGLVSHLVLDGGRLVVAHAGLRQDLQGRISGKVRSFALFGDTTGQTDEHGLPVRRNWAAEYRGPALVVYGHTPVAEAAWENNTVNVDLGCVFGGRLAALRYPEREVVSVPSRRRYCEPGRPFLAGERPAGGGPLGAEDGPGPGAVETRLLGAVRVPEAGWQAAREWLVRSTADSRWVVYLPPVMASAEGGEGPGGPEHPSGAFAYYRRAGQGRVVCEEKHAGARAVVVVCRDEGSARRAFGAEGELGAVLTRAGRRFFGGGPVEAELVGRLRGAIDRAGLWWRWATGWAVLDAELMPWPPEGREGRARYAAGRAALAEALGGAGGRAGVDAYAAAYRRHCWPAGGVEGLRLAPFHLLATEGAAHFDRPHLWHLEELASLGDGGGLLHLTEYRVVELGGPQSVESAVAWWEGLVARGGEGVVVKPADFVARGERGLVQPAVKCRAAGAAPGGAGGQRRQGHKRSVAVRQLALGVEALERFVRGEPAARVRECCLAVLALEGESGGSARGVRVGPASGWSVDRPGGLSYNQEEPPMPGGEDQ